MSSIRFFNTYSGQLENFEPLNPKEKEVRIYTCGPTVYDYAHIGNFRAFVFEDLLRRFLEFKGFKVKHVMNITDVDDKTIAGAKHEGKSLQDFTEIYIHAFHEDLKTLNILPANYPAHEPRATQEIPAMIELIEKLLKKGAAYVSEGSVYYRVASFPGYGRLSKKDLRQNLKGARVDRDEYEKEEGSDFALWKKAKVGEPAWDSPWGKGRPGWHIECSAMSMKYLGETFDIHAGGEDLIFPHHENEIAQSEAATGKKFVHYWFHCKHLLVNGEKMSKSKGNFYTLRDLLAKGYDPMAIRYALLSVHYRQQLNFTEKVVQDAEVVLARWKNCYFKCFNFKEFGNFEINLKDQNYFNYDLASYKTFLEEGMSSILEGSYFSPTGLSNDLDISYVLGAEKAVHDIVRHINFGLDKKVLTDLHLDISIKFFKDLDRLLGLRITDEGNVPPPEVLKLQERRDTFRGSPEFIKSPELQRLSDEIRAKIQELGWDVKDGRPGESSIITKKTVKQRV